MSTVVAMSIIALYLVVVEVRLHQNNKREMMARKKSEKMFNDIRKTIELKREESRLEKESMAH